MGYITIFTIYNDSASLIDPSQLENKDNILQLANAVYGASRNLSSEASLSYPIGNHSNLINAQRPRHASDNAIYVLLGNTLTEIDVKSSKTRSLIERNPKFAKDILQTLEQNLKDFKELMKDTNNR